MSESQSVQQLIDAHEFEVRNLVAEWRSKIRVAAPAAALDLIRERNKALIDKLNTQERILAFQLGQKVEPVVHHAEAVVTGRGGVA